MNTINRLIVIAVIGLGIAMHFSFKQFKYENVRSATFYDTYFQNPPEFKNVYLNECLYTGDKSDSKYYHFVYERNPVIVISFFDRMNSISRDEGRFKNNFFKSRSRGGYVKDGKQDGEWITTDRSLGDRYICRKEYFKNGIREGEYIIFSHTGDTLYSTVFVNGKGVEKDYYPNGQLYYVGAKDAGYFVDTLKVYRPDGMIIRETLYHPYSTEKLYEKGYYYKGNTNLLVAVIINKTDNDTIFFKERYYTNGSLGLREFKLKDKYKYVMEGDKGKYLSNGGGYVKNGDYVRDVFQKLYYRDTITFDLIRVERKQWQEKVEE